MEQSNWSGTYPFPTASTDAAPAPPPLSPYELRPLAAGEILDRVLSIYRGHFWLLAGLSAVPAGVSIATQITRLIYLHFVPARAGSISFLYVTYGFAIVQWAFYLVTYSLTIAATTAAVNSIYLGESTSLGRAFSAARGLWVRCLGVGIWQGWSAIWAFVLLAVPFTLMARTRGSGSAAVLAILLVIGFLAAFVYGIIAYLRNSLAVPAAVIENLGVRSAMRRSKNLATGRVGRIFLLFLLVYALYLVAAVILVPLGILTTRTREAQLYLLQGIILAVNFITTTLVGPVAAIGLCLFYFDERVRREGFDIEVMLRGASIPSPAILAIESPDNISVVVPTNPEQELL
jgi:hypothetical protein